MLFLYRTALDNQYVDENLQKAKSTLYFYDTKTHERFSATLLSIYLGQPLIDDRTDTGKMLYSSTSKWRIELSNGQTYTRKLEHRTATDIHYPEGWDDGTSISSPVSLMAMNCTKGGSLRVGIDADSWIQVERGDML